MPGTVRGVRWRRWVLAAVAIGALLALGGLVTAAELAGTDGNDRIEGGDEADAIEGKRGDDHIE